MRADPSQGHRGARPRIRITPAPQQTPAHDEVLEGRYPNLTGDSSVRLEEGSPFGQIQVRVLIEDHLFDGLEGTQIGVCRQSLYSGDGKGWFDAMIDLSFNIMLPVGGLGIAMFVAWRVGNRAREEGFKAGTKLGRLYWGWI